MADNHFLDSEGEDEEMPQNSKTPVPASTPAAPPPTNPSETRGNESDDDGFDDFDEQAEEEPKNSDNVSVVESRNNKAHFQDLADKVQAYDDSGDEGVGPTLTDTANNTPPPPAVPRTDRSSEIETRKKTVGGTNKQKEAWTPNHLEKQVNEGMMASYMRPVIVIADEDGNAKVVDILPSLEKNYKDIEFTGPIVGIGTDFPHIDKLDAKHDSPNKGIVSLRMEFEPTPDLANALVFYKKGPNTSNWKTAVQQVAKKNPWTAWSQLVKLEAVNKKTGKLEKHFFILLHNGDQYKTDGFPLLKKMSDCMTKLLREHHERVTRGEESKTPVWLVDATFVMQVIKASFEEKQYNYMFKTLGKDVRDSTARSKAERAEARMFHNIADDNLVIVEKFSITQDKKQTRNAPRSGQSKLNFGKTAAPAAEQPPAALDSDMEQEGEVDNSNTAPSAIAPAEVAPAPAAVALAPPSADSPDPNSDASNSNQTAIVRRQAGTQLAKRGADFNDDDDDDSSDEYDPNDAPWYKLIKRMKPLVFPKTERGHTIALFSQNASWQSINTGYNILTFK